MTSSSTSENIKSHPPDGSATQRGSVFLEKKLVPMGSPEDFEGQAKVMPKFWHPCTGT